MSGAPRLTDELKPCPWCEAMPKLSTSAFHGGYATCHGTPEHWHEVITMRIDDWNRRAQVTEECAKHLEEAARNASNWGRAIALSDAAKIVRELSSPRQTKEEA